MFSLFFRCLFFRPPFFCCNCSTSLRCSLSRVIFERSSQISESLASHGPMQPQEDPLLNKSPSLSGKASSSSRFQRGPSPPHSMGPVFFLKPGDFFRRSPLDKVKSSPGGLIFSFSLRPSRDQVSPYPGVRSIGPLLTRAFPLRARPS